MIRVCSWFDTTLGWKPGPMPKVELLQSQASKTRGKQSLAPTTDFSIEYINMTKSISPWKDGFSSPALQDRQRRDDCISEQSVCTCRNTSEPSDISLQHLSLRKTQRHCFSSLVKPLQTATGPTLSHQHTSLAFDKSRGFASELRPRCLVFKIRFACFKENKNRAGC